MPADKPTELSRIKHKTWTWQPVPKISKHSAHSTSLPVGFRTWLWRYTCLLLLISMLWHRQAIFESKGDKLLHTYIHTYIHIYIHTYIHTCIHTCLLLLISMLCRRQAIFESKGDKLSSSAEGRIRTHQGLRHQIASRLNAHWQTDWAIEDQAKNLNSTARPYDQRAFSPLDPTAVLAFAPGSGDIHVCCCKFRCSGAGKRYSNRKETSCLPLLKAGFEPIRVSDTKSPADWMPTDKPTELSKIKLKTWTRQPVPMISEHSAHSTHIHTYIHTYLLF